MLMRYCRNHRDGGGNNKVSRFQDWRYLKGSPQSRARSQITLEKPSRCELRVGKNYAIQISISKNKYFI